MFAPNYTYTQPQHSPVSPLPHTSTSAVAYTADTTLTAYHPILAITLNDKPTWKEPSLGGEFDDEAWIHLVNVPPTQILPRGSIKLYEMLNIEKIAFPEYTRWTPHKLGQYYQSRNCIIEYADKYPNMFPMLRKLTVALGDEFTQRFVHASRIFKLLLAIGAIYFDNNSTEKYRIIDILQGIKTRKSRFYDFKTTPVQYQEYYYHHQQQQNSRLHTQVMSETNLVLPTECTTTTTTTTTNYDLRCDEEDAIPSSIREHSEKKRKRDDDNNEESTTDDSVSNNGSSDNLLRLPPSKRVKHNSSISGDKNTNDLFSVPELPKRLQKEVTVASVVSSGENIRNIIKDFRSRANETTVTPETTSVATADTTTAAAVAAAAADAEVTGTAIVGDRDVVDVTLTLPNSTQLPTTAEETMITETSTTTTTTTTTTTPSPTELESISSDAVIPPVIVIEDMDISDDATPADVATADAAANAVSIITTPPASPPPSFCIPKPLTTTITPPSSPIPVPMAPKKATKKRRSLEKFQKSLELFKKSSQESLIETIQDYEDILSELHDKIHGVNEPLEKAITITSNPIFANDDKYKKLAETLSSLSKTFRSVLDTAIEYEDRIIALMKDNN